MKKIVFLLPLILFLGSSCLHSDEINLATVDTTINTEKIVSTNKLIVNSDFFDSYQENNDTGMIEATKMISNNSQEENFTFVFFRHEKDSNQDITDYLNENDLPAITSYEGNCKLQAENTDIEIYNCGRWAQENIIINKKGTDLLSISLGQDPVFSEQEMLNFLSVK